MDYIHRGVIKKYSLYLQRSINLQDIKNSLRKSKIFTACMLKDIYDGEASFFEELQTRGPEAFFRFIDLLKSNGHTTIAEELCHVANPTYLVPWTPSHKHGYYLIILSKKFEGLENSAELSELMRGYTLEAAALDSALQKNFVNHEYRVDLKAKELYSELEEFSKLVSRSDVYSCIVIILGFGSKIQDSRVIYGYDGKYILLNDILNLFSDTNCPSFKHKPKIFLLPSFDVCNDSVERVILPADVNDTFLWSFPPSKVYKYINDVKLTKFFGEILSDNRLKLDLHTSDFENILKLSYRDFLSQLKKNNIPTDDLTVIPECERLGFCREKILFTTSNLKSQISE